MYGQATPLDFVYGGMSAGSGLYQKARSKARMNSLKSLLTRSNNYLMSLEDVLREKNVRGQRYGGRETVQIDRIVGSEGRTGDFDRRFYPRSDRSRGRFLSVLSARLHGVALPPVSLIRVGDQYVVVDGHHRISVARALDEAFIEAKVKVLEIDA